MGAVQPAIGENLPAMGAYRHPVTLPAVAEREEEALLLELFGADFVYGAMRYSIALALALLAAVVLGRAGPDTAGNAMLVAPGCKVAVRVNKRACPPPVLCDLTIDLPSPGYDLSKPAVQIDAKQKRIRIDLRATMKPGDAAWPQVMTPTKTTASLGVLKKGRYVVEVRYAVGKDSPLQPHHVFLIDAVG